MDKSKMIPLNVRPNTDPVVLAAKVQDYKTRIEVLEQANRNLSQRLSVLTNEFAANKKKMIGELERIRSVINNLGNRMTTSARTRGK
jgi:hypothetical protein